jgi:hypothetical protein
MSINKIFNNEINLIITNLIKIINLMSFVNSFIAIYLILSCIGFDGVSFGSSLVYFLIYDKLTTKLLF